MARRVVTVFGGSGFIGRHLVGRLVSGAEVIRVAVRDPEGANFLKTAGDVGQVVPVPASVREKATVEAAVAGADTVVNLVGILHESGRQTFENIHAEGAGTVAAAAQRAGVERLVHVSALGAGAASPARYARTKAAGETAVLEAFPNATIVRPSVVFGPEDNFFNLFAAMARLSPVLPVFGCPWPPKVRLFKDGNIIGIDLYGNGGTQFQPVYVGDVADAIVAILGGAGTAGGTYELGGPRVYAFKEIMELLLDEIGRRRFLAPIPFAIGAIAAWFLEMLPVPPLTRDQLKLLRRDNIVGGEALNIADLGINPVAAEAILPSYLRRYRPPNRMGLRPV